MTMSINLQTGGYIAPQSLPGARGADIQVVQKQIESSPEFTLPAPGSNSGDVALTPEQRRYNQVTQAAQRLAGGDPYPISDRSFTIYKDASGQYVTRYTSLRDGRVTYIPEQKLLQAFERSQSSLREAVVALNA
jgi:hypothetical protein